MLNWLAYAVALYVASRFAPRVADALLANWVMGHVAFMAAGGVNLPSLIAFDFLTGVYLLLLGGNVARIVALFCGLSIILNGALYIGRAVPDLWINGLAWAQIAALYIGVFGDGLGALVDRLSGGGGNRHPDISSLSAMEEKA